MANRQMNESELALLYNAIGRAVWHVQYTEEALALHLAMRLELKDLRKRPAAEVSEIVAKYRRNTLGSSLRIANASGVFGPALQTQLDKFKEERDWLADAMTAYYAMQASEASLQSLAQSRNRVVPVQNFSVVLKRLTGTMIPISTYNGQSASLFDGGRPLTQDEVNLLIVAASLATGAALWELAMNGALAGCRLCREFRRADRHGGSRWRDRLLRCTRNCPRRKRTG